PLPDPGAVRRAGPDRSRLDRGRAGSRPGAGAHLHPGHPPPVQAGDPDRGAAHDPAHARRLLHQPNPVRHDQHDDDRQRHRRAAADTGVPGGGRGLVADAAAHPDDPDDLLRGRHQPLVEDGGMSAADVTTEAARPAAAGARARSARLWPRGNPWRHPWFLEGFTWLYLLWSLVPIGIAVLFSFNNGRSQAVWQGFSWRWYFADPVNSVLHDPNLHAAVVQTVRLSVYVTLVTVPLGVAFALGINRWRGKTASTANFLMIL